jgi:hypothetical protein
MYENKKKQKCAKKSVSKDTIVHPCRLVKPRNVAARESARHAVQYEIHSGGRENR